MYDLNGMTITLTAGDTAAFTVRPKYTFADGDKALFTVKNGNGTVVIRRWYDLDENTESFMVCFHGQDTVNLAPGSYRWDIRYYLSPKYAETEDEPTNNDIVDADQILTPYAPQLLILTEPIGSL